MNLKYIIFAVMLSLGTLTFPDTADARSWKKRRHHHSRSYYYGHNHNHYYGRHYRTYRYRYYPRAYYYDPYYYPSRSQLYLRVGPLTVRRW